MLEPAAVAGLVFPSQAVVELSPTASASTSPRACAAVERRRFIRSHAAVMGDADGYQFEHILVRDAVYRRLLKRTRAQMHERFVDWADRVNGDRAAGVRRGHRPTTSSRRTATWPSSGRWTTTAASSASARASGWPAPASGRSSAATCTPRPASCAGRST